MGGNLNTCGGPDFYALNAGAGQTITAAINFVHMLGDVDMRLYDGMMNQVSSSAGTMDNETIEYLVEMDGTYFVEVYGFSDVYNEYTMSVSVQ